MNTLNDTAEPVNPEPTYNDLCEVEHNAEQNTYPADHSADDERWFAEATRDAEPEPDDADWDAFDDFVVECGPDPEPDWAILMGERWTIA